MCTMAMARLERPGPPSDEDGRAGHEETNDRGRQEDRHQLPPRHARAASFAEKDEHVQRQAERGHGDDRAGRREQREHDRRQHQREPESRRRLHARRGKGVVHTPRPTLKCYLVVSRARRAYFHS